MRIRKPEIQRCLAISTAHITQRDDELLTQDGQWYLSGSDKPNPNKGYLLVAPKYAGHFVCVWDEECASGAIETKDLLERGFSQAFLDILNWARKKNIHWLLLDADGPEYDGLPTFDW